MAGYSGTPLLKKLGIKPDQVLFFSNAPQSYFDELAPLPENVRVSSTMPSRAHFIHLFCTSQSDLQKKLLKARSHLRDDGMIWVSWPKKASKVETDLDENNIREFGLKAGLVDVKVCAVDQTWSGLKFVIPVRDRKG
jgi:hypothetical protein